MRSSAIQVFVVCLACLPSACRDQEPGPSGSFVEARPGQVVLQVGGDTVLASGHPLSTEEIRDVPRSYLELVVGPANGGVAATRAAMAEAEIRIEVLHPGAGRCLERVVEVLAELGVRAVRVSRLPDTGRGGGGRRRSQVVTPGGEPELGAGRRADENE